jgi:hypothetical protein
MFFWELVATLGFLLQEAAERRGAKPLGGPEDEPMPEHFE